MLAPRLTPPLLGPALDAARAIGNEWSRARPGGVAPHLTPPRAAQAQKAARAIWKRNRGPGRWRRGAHRTPPERDQALSQALKAARAIWDKESRARGRGVWRTTLTPPDATRPSARP